MLYILKTLKIRQQASAVYRGDIDILIRRQASAVYLIIWEIYKEGILKPIRENGKCLNSISDELMIDNYAMCVAVENKVLKNK